MSVNVGVGKLLSDGSSGCCVPAFAMIVGVGMIGYGPRIRGGMKDPQRYT